MPAVFSAPIRPDIVAFVHRNISKNKRQPYAVSKRAGHQHSAESWGTGRALARVPRVSGGGTSRSGQAAFANFARKGHMYAPTKIWRRWHRVVPVYQRRLAVVSALAATAVPALVMARGHLIGELSEVPYVADNALESITRTKDAVAFLKHANLYADVKKVIDTVKRSTTIGKLRNRRTIHRKGPMVIYGTDSGVVQAFRNIPGVELCQAERLSLNMLAPGGQMGRLVVWTKSAIEMIAELYNGEKTGFDLPVPMVAQPDIGRIINSPEVQAVLRPAKPALLLKGRARKNPLRNHTQMQKLNPYFAKSSDEAEMAKLRKEVEQELGVDACETPVRKDGPVADAMRC